MGREPKTGQGAVDAVKGLMEVYHQRMKERKFQGFEKKLMDSLKLERVEPDNTVVFSIFLGPEYQHVGNSLHGGAAALILDQCTSLAISPNSAPGYWEWVGGVTRTITLTCIRAVPAKSADTTVHVRCRVVAIGQTAVLVRGEITSTDGKVIYDVVEHNKLNVRLQPKKSPDDSGKAKL